MSNAGEPTGARIKVREVAAVFRTRQALQEAVDALLLAGFDRADIDLMAGVEAVRQKLGGIYLPAEELADVPDVPRRAFTTREDVVVPLANVAGILTYIGATAAALGVVASGGALALAAAAAAAGGLAGGGVGVFIAQSLGRPEAQALEEAMRKGGLVLWVRVRSPEREAKAQEILREHGGEAIRVHEIEIDKRFEETPLSSLVVDPWLGSEPLGAP